MVQIHEPIKTESVESKTDPAIELLKIFLENVSLLGSEERKEVLNIIKELIMPKYKILSKLPIEEDYLKKKGGEM